ncbi:hypothetical protein KFK09_020242 [Dendrobium nobile]|uniref:Uncharacterized protein n=1 Tax=Dendrobium nobile TaxID=94219 RepID=A0A8T3ASR6_DENNO|nr:hypothetical protein KFK09_020242 [Dendrobium nobile]
MPLLDDPPPPRCHPIVSRLQRVQPKVPPNFGSPRSSHACWTLPSLQAAGSDTKMMWYSTEEAGSHKKNTKKARDRDVAMPAIRNSNKQTPCHTLMLTSYHIKLLALLLLLNSSMAARAVEDRFAYQSLESLGRKEPPPPPPLTGVPISPTMSLNPNLINFSP